MHRCGENKQKLRNFYNSRSPNVFTITCHFYIKHRRIIFTIHTDEATNNNINMHRIIKDFR